MIEHYGFGRLEANGRSFAADLIILLDRIQASCHLTC